MFICSDGDLKISGAGHINLFEFLFFPCYEVIHKPLTFWVSKHISWLCSAWFVLLYLIYSFSDWQCFLFYACLNYMFPHSCIASCSPAIFRNFWFTASLIVTLIKGYGDSGYWEGQPCCWDGIHGESYGRWEKSDREWCLIFSALTRMLALVENHEAKGYNRLYF